MTYILILAPLSCPDIVVQKYLLIVLVLVLDFPLIHKSFSVGNAYGFVFWCFSTKIKQSFTQELFPMEARKWAHFYKYVYFLQQIRFQTSRKKKGNTVWTVNVVRWKPPGGNPKLLANMTLGFQMGGLHLPEVETPHLSC